MPMTNGLPPHVKTSNCCLLSLQALVFGCRLTVRPPITAAAAAFGKRVFETPARCKMSDLDLSRST